MAVGDAFFHDFAELETHALVGKLAFAGARYRNKGVAVTDYRRKVGGFFKALAKLLRKIGQLPDRRVFLENQLPVLIGENLQRVALADAQSAADLLGNNNAAEVIDSAHDAGCFHIYIISLVCKSCL